MSHDLRLVKDPEQWQRRETENKQPRKLMNKETQKTWNSPESVNTNVLEAVAQVHNGCTDLGYPFDMPGEWIL